MSPGASCLSRDRPPLGAVGHHRRIGRGFRHSECERSRTAVRDVLSAGGSAGVLGALRYQLWSSGRISLVRIERDATRLLDTVEDSAGKTLVSEFI